MIVSRRYRKPRMAGGRFAFPACMALALLLHFPAEAQIRDDRSAPLTLEPALIEKPSLKPGECDADTLRKLAVGRKGIDDGLASADQAIEEEEQRLAELMEEENYIAVTIGGLKDEMRHIDAAIADNEASLRASIPPVTAIKEAERLQRAKATNTSNLDYQFKLREANREELNAAKKIIRTLMELRAKTLADIAKHQTAMEALCTNAQPAKPSEPVTVKLDNLPNVTDPQDSGDAPCVGPQCLTVASKDEDGESTKQQLETLDAMINDVRLSIEAEESGMSQPRAGGPIRFLFGLLGVPIDPGEGDAEIEDRNLNRLDDRLSELQALRKKVAAGNVLSQTELEKVGVSNTPAWQEMDIWDEGEGAAPETAGEDVDLQDLITPAGEHNEDVDYTKGQ